jgi:penicillin-binding protein 2
LLLQKESNRQLILQRLNLFRLPVLLIFLILGARLWQLQIIKGAEYERKAERNGIRTIELVAPRGVIFDRHHTPLVENRSSFDVLLYREWIKDADATKRFLAEKLSIRPENLENALRRGKESGLYRPIIIKEDAGMMDISVIEAHRMEHPEIQLGSEPRRLYHYGKLAAHILGYVGEISEQDLKGNLFPGARAGSLVGQSGVERTYNAVLAGKDGERRVQVDSRGREVAFVTEKEAVKGGEIQLTIDLDLQAVAELSLEGKVGAIVAMDPSNGEILAMASAPAYDPNTFAMRISRDDWKRLVEHPDRPLQNRAIQNSYSPGSVFKLVMAQAALEEGLVDNDTTIFCGGAASYYGRVFHCGSGKGHGSLRLEQAIAQSCNIFFYELGRRLGISRIARHAQALGFGEKTGIDLPAEKSGVMPSPEWKMRTHRTKWFAGETISVSIGQGAVSATPLQILRAVSAIATGGLLTTPHLLLRSENRLGNAMQWPMRRLPISHNSARRIREGMWASVNGFGTGRNAAVRGLDICGKTGTVQVIGRGRNRPSRGDMQDHSWFVGFAPKDRPEIAVVAFVEHGGTGGVSAAPLARALFQAYFEKQGRIPGADTLAAVAAAAPAELFRARRETGSSAGAVER